MSCAGGKEMLDEGHNLELKSYMITHTLPNGLTSRKKFGSKPMSNLIAMRLMIY